MAKEPKERHYRLEYWNIAGTKITEESSFENKNEAFKWIFEFGFLPLNVRFIGWR